MFSAFRGSCIRFLAEMFYKTDDFKQKENVMFIRKIICLAGVLAAAPILATVVVESPPPISVVLDYGMQGTVNNRALPPALRHTAEEAKVIAERRAADWRVLGYVPKQPYRSGHYFREWTRGYIWENRRDLFGLTPYGSRGIEKNGVPDWLGALSKMCVSNEGVVDMRIERWKREGMPQQLIAGENDGFLGFCRCKGCKALDADLPGEPFLKNKTDRYLNLWNRICEKARRLRPDVRVCVFAYSLLRHPPRRERVAFPDNLIVSYVPTYHDISPGKAIMGWKSSGLRHFYNRPNFLCNQTVFPIGREKYIYEVDKALRRLGSLGSCYDATHGVASTGFEMYTAVRICADPGVSFDEIEHGWCARFGAASNTVQAYYCRVRERCDRRWERLLSVLSRHSIEFLDDSHFSRCYHVLHTEKELENDLRFLEKFDGSVLSGEEGRRFADLKLVAQHFVLTRKAFGSRSAADKERLVAFRSQWRDRLGFAWAAHWNKGELPLWENSYIRRFYSDLGISSYVETFENALRSTPARQLMRKMESPLDEALKDFEQSAEDEAGK